MFVEGRQQLDATRRVVQLMAETPEQYRFMTNAMPPVEDQTRDEISQESGSDVTHVFGNVQQGSAAKPLVPCQTRKDDNRDLGNIQQNDARPPPFDRRQRPRGPQTFDRKKLRRVNQ